MRRRIIYTEEMYEQIMNQAGHRIDLRDASPVEIWHNLFGTMLFPEDQKKRQLWIFRFFLYTLSLEYKNLTSDGQIDMQTACEKIGKDFAYLSKYIGGPWNLTALLFDSQTQGILHERESRLSNGKIAGDIFLLALNSKKSLIEIIKKYIKKTHAASEKTIQDYWLRYLPMIHYWAALITFIRHDGFHLEATSMDEIFDCPAIRQKGCPDGVRGFVRIAESYLMQGINDFPQRRGPKKPLLDITKMFFVQHPFSHFSPGLILSDTDPARHRRTPC